MNSRITTRFLHAQPTVWMKHICQRQESSLSRITRLSVQRLTNIKLKVPASSIQPLYRSYLLQKCREMSENGGKKFLVDEEEEVDENDSSFGETDRNEDKILGSKTLASFKENCMDHSLRMTTEDWQDLENQILVENPFAGKALEATIMSLLFNARNMNLAENLLTYIHGKGTSPNRTTLSTFIAMCGTCCGKEKQNLVFEAYEDLLKITDLFDFYTLKNLIIGFSFTDRWKMCLEFIEMTRLTGKPTSVFYSPVVSAAIRNGDVGLVMDLLRKMGEEGIRPRESVFEDFVRNLGHPESAFSIESFIDCLKKYHWLVSRDTILLLEEYFTRSENVRTKLTYVDKRGVCQGCRHQLDRIELSRDQFKDLQHHMLNNVLIGENVYLQSNPLETERFKNFIKSYTPFDVVLDALNCVYTNVRRKSVHTSMSAQLRRIVEHFALDQRKKVAVIGRKHMQNWNHRDLQVIERISRVFYADNISKDDPFALYAAIYSGRRCLIMSEDQMKDHKFKLGPHMKEVFEQWQRSHQIIPVKSKAPVSYMLPSNHETGPQSDPGGWHIPYEGEQERPVYMRPNTWLCVRRQGR